MRQAFVLLAVVGVMASNTAVAAEMAVKAQVAPTVRDWSGVYAGLNAGYGWAGADWLDTTSSPAATFFDYTPGQGFSNRLSGVFGGAQVGVNFQNGSWVFGVEAMLDASALEGNFTSNTPLGAGDDQFKARVEALAVVSGKIGYAVGNWLAYGKAGYAAAKIHASVNDTTPPATGSGSASQWRSGPAAGLGFEYGVTPALSIGIEYDHLWLDSGSYQLGGSAGTYIWNVGIRDVDLLMARLNYHFGR